jgi:CubicO group peptidase (beta-lactamase class C family)
MKKGMKVGLGCAGLVVVFLLVSLAAVFGYVIHERHQYKNLPDTHDLSQRTARFGVDYVTRRPEAGLVIGVYQGDHANISGFGRSSATRSDPPDGQTLFEIGSITKVFTGVTLARLVQDGVVKFSDPISFYLPPGTVSPKKNGHEITLEQLATHTSGLPRLPPNWNATVTNELNPYLSYTAADLYQSLAQVQLSAEPGKTSDYSNYGFGLLGQLLSRKTGLPYETLVLRTVCEPLGLTNTLMHLNAEQRDRLAPGHNPQGQIVPNWDMDALAGCGALRSNAHDLLTLVSANLETNNTPIYRALAEARTYHFKEFSGGVGLGWQIAEPVDGRVVCWHNGGTGGYYSFIAFDRQNHVGVVILSNYGDAFAGDNTIDQIGMELLKLAGKVSWQ